jgi:uncharacterized repeat protein (TIGR03806 family)
MGKLVCLLACAAIACGSPADPEREGPALQPRPGIQTCLADMPQMPNLLSETLCFTDLITMEPGPDLIPYEVNSSLWTDGAFKPRYLVVPPGSSIAIQEDGSWDFPEQSVLIKNFGFEFSVGDPNTRRGVETRFMVMRSGRWEFSTYRWNAEGSDALLLSELEERIISIADQGELREFDYLFPDEETCETCHGSPGQVLGLRTAQVNRDRDYEGLVENQLVAMAQIGLFGEGVEIDPRALDRMAAPQGEESSLDARARAYLDVNCAHCHKPGGWAPIDTALDLRFEVPLAQTGLCQPMKYFNWTGIPRILPGNADGSGILQRFVMGGTLRMPSIGTARVDPLGAELLSDWIDRLDACP